jgi:hypothetical protein
MASPGKYSDSFRAIKTLSNFKHFDVFSEHVALLAMRNRHVKWLEATNSNLLKRHTTEMSIGKAISIYETNIVHFNFDS